mmetsp:Transcript_401/g.920  ORF Transcript_401/g.920 Transcript_401/m.920 type:complete len:176 (-) Transcript_401:116-643(-)|eukprot:CAMPEP_0197183558 /NCGR_PEP_ID=MMETSP1423-20130617/7880_1 /TAXON_ID=476441 /ORGANISM="Pseudo-nitzschia heimii, Strain UNC1101" /LENGTH=175 /DNA_ID=CAMNT_0042634143 /DNA_START=135 /DNA_END=662 /DNA_ORIENTATION=-
MSSQDQDDVEAGEYIQEDAGDTTFLCCGICDMRIAVIFMMMFNVGATLIGALVAGISSNLFWKAIGVTFAAGIPSLILSGVGLYGAKEFHLKAMYITCGGFAFLMLLDAILWEWVGFVINAIILFPTTVFTFEMNNGVLSKENYPEQEFVSAEGMGWVDRAHAYIAPTPPSLPTN